MTREYAMRVLTFLRLALREDQSLIAGSGVGEYIQIDDKAALGIVDTVHIGGFLNFAANDQMRSLYDRLDEAGMTVVENPVLNSQS